MCGERIAGVVFAARPYGSSPRVRGTRHKKPLLQRLLRIIPACAGNAYELVYDDPEGADHPRVCGERFATFWLACRVTGSSPRVRGTLTNAYPQSIRQRIIPACAGNAALSALFMAGNPDHPRVCGERSPSLLLSEPSSGSSPRVRGTLSKSMNTMSITRIIPACAGNAKTGRRVNISALDHPRVCGERQFGGI